MRSSFLMTKPLMIITSIGITRSFNGTQAYALRFYYDAAYNKNNHLRCLRYYYNNNTNTLGALVGEVADMSQVKSQLIDILNYHTVVLNAGQTIADNHYFKTKHGGEIYVSGSTVGSTVQSGAQIDNGQAKSA